MKTIEGNLTNIVRKLKLKLALRTGSPFNLLGKKNPVNQLCAEKGEVFGYFVTDDRRNLPLFKGYRDHMKANWRESFWPTIALKSLSRRITLPPEAADIWTELKKCPTLPFPIDEFANVVSGLVKKYPKLLMVSDIQSTETVISIIAVVPSDKEIHSIASLYRGNAFSVLETFFQFAGRVEINRLSVLEIGCGMGYGVAAMAGFGPHSTGIDLKMPDYRDVCERERVLQRLGLNSKKSSSRVNIMEGDSEELPFEDRKFDLIYSSSVLEHIHNLKKALNEMARVLKPGGIMIHNATFYFAPSGGHASCTLDFPWGHVRLSPQEFQRYLKEFRPHEYKFTTHMYKNLFNEPHLSFQEIEGLFMEAGLSILSWKENWLSHHLPTSSVWKEISALYPFVNLRDLSVNSLKIVCVKK